MSLKTRIIPCLDVKNGRVVKGVNFVDLVDAGDPVEQAKLYDAQGADELCLLDITASSDNRDTIYDVVTRVAEACFIPLTVGGGVRTIDDIRKLLNAGADKVSINTAAIHNPEFVREAAEKFGTQCIVVAIDAKKALSDNVKATQQQEENHSLTLRNSKEALSADNALQCAGARQAHGEGQKTEAGANTNTYEIFTHGGRNPTGINAVEWAKRMVAYGAGELLVTSMDRDGTKAGFDLPMTRAIADAVSVPVIASGGVGELAHFAEGVNVGHASALLAASVFHFGTFTIAQVKEALQDADIAVRKIR